MIDYQADPVFWQRFLKCGDFYQGKLDGDFGPQSHAAAEDFETKSQDLARSSSLFDIRSEGNIQTLQIIAQKKSREFLEAVISKLGGNGLLFRIISGTRTYQEQNDLFALGRTKPGRIVTNAGGGFSNHNFGVAWDIGIFKNGDYIPESELYKSVGIIGKQQGLEWGGDWASFQDEPHFQVVAETELADIRASFENGQSFIV